MENNIHLPLCFQLKDEVKREMRHFLKVLPNNLITCKVKVGNNTKKIEITCNALIDTGAEITLVCSTVFEKLSFDHSEISIHGTSTLDAEHQVPVCLLNLTVPYKNWSSHMTPVFIKDISKREEYQVIIGMDILSNFQLMYNGLTNTAWLDEF